jgi:hypothetical protein
LLALAAGLTLVAPAAPQVKRDRIPPPSPVPSPSARMPAMRLEPVAETRLLMEGLTQPNFQGLEKLLRARPREDEAWTFARGQALLIAETGNLLLLRPPRQQGQADWVERAADLRTKATRLARSTANRDYDASRVGLVELGNACNRCHETFRVPARVGAPADR